MVEELQPKRDLSRSLVQVGFILQNTPRYTLKLPDLTVAWLTRNALISKVDISLFLWKERNTLAGVIVYNTDLFDAATIAQMADHYQLLLEAIVDNPNQSLSALPDFTLSTIAVKQVTSSESIYERSNLTENQLLIWIGQKLQPGIPLYNMPLFAILAKEIQPILFQTAFQTLINSSDALRTVIDEVDGIPQQRVREDFSYQLEYIDLSQTADPYSQLHLWMAERAQICFDFSQRLFDTALIKLSDREFVWYINLHHIISDGWGAQIIFQCVTEFYQQALKGELKAVEALPLFQDYIAYERKQRGSKRYQEAATYWQHKLADDIAPITFYGKTAQPQNIRLHRVNCQLGFDRTERLQTIAKQETISIFKSLAATLFAYLYRISGNQQLALGIPFHNRRSKTFKGTIGPFLAVLPIQVNIEYAETFLSLISKLKVEIFETLRHGEYGVRNPTHRRAFDIFLNYHNESLFEFDFNGALAKVGWIHTEYENYNLGLQIHDLGLSGNLVVSFDFNLDLFSPQEQDWLIHHYLQTLDSFLEDRTQPLYSINLLSALEREVILIGFNQTEKIFFQDDNLARLFEQQVDRTPETIAVVYASEQLTYQELNQRANQLAHYLKQMGIGREALVGVCLERSLEMVIGLLAILKTGAAYLPFDPSYPKDRLAFMLEDSKVKVLLVQQQIIATLPDTQAEIVCLDKEWHTIASQCIENPIHEITADNLTYVIYTSGSTGRPKGVMNTHRGVCNRLLWMQDTYNLTSVDRVLQKTPFSFDVSVWEFFWPLITGARLVVAKPGGHQDSNYLVELIGREQITVVHFVPSMLQLFLQEENLTPCRCLKQVICSGEALSVNLQKQFYQRLAAQLDNLYGPTEAAIDVTFWTCLQENRLTTVPIGKPIANTQIYILDKYLTPLPVGIAGELHIGGIGLARGYINRAELTAEKFIPNPFSNQLGGRLYKTGDLARYLPDGNIEFLGRIDDQVKIRGLRIELGEIVVTLMEHPQIKDAIVVARELLEENVGIEKRLVAYLIPTENSIPSTSELRKFLQERLPDYMLPSAFVVVDTFPLTPNGKVDRKALPEPTTERPELDINYVAPQTELEQMIADAWKETLKIDSVGRYDNFFDLGGHSLLLIQVEHKLSTAFGKTIPLIDMFKYPTIDSLAKYLTEQQCVEVKPVLHTQQINKLSTEGIAIIGMAARFPGVDNIDQFWQNLCNGVESISFFSDEELLDAGVDPKLLKKPNYVKARGVLKDIELFDATFFGFSPREAELLDPQHRIFLEIAWEALENAGYNSEIYPGRIGVYAGAGTNTYLLSNLYSNSELIESLGFFQTILANDKDYLPTRVSYKLNLRGPSVSVQTACSTSLVAVCLACESLLNHQSDIVLAGGVTISLPKKRGYLYEEGGIHSPDGHCRAFDAKAQGMVGGNGAGIVVLKRLSDALADADTIHAVIKGSAINNDGSLKIGYTAPSVEGQSEVIARAQAIAGIQAEDITYVEAHGTGTALGDPIEVRALTEAFRATTRKQHFCALGSVKTNIGHLDTAAGIAGLIKTVLSLKNRMLPASLHFVDLNPQIDFTNSPFYINNQLCEWKADKQPRRAGVSSFGIGGTNAHVIVEEAPVREISTNSAACQLLVLSAKTNTALEKATTNLALYLKQHQELNLADVAYTLQVGRRVFNHRRMLVCHSLTDAITTLETLDPKRVATTFQEIKNRSVAFMFSGQGSQYLNMGLDLYRTEPIFRQQIDTCAELLYCHLGFDLRERLYSAKVDSADVIHQLNRTSITQPALFVTEYALAKLYMELGIYPKAMIGHSIGEYVAACLAGVFSLEDGLALVAARGRLMENLPAGAMLAVPLSENEIASLLTNNELSLAAINGPTSCVLSGSIEAIQQLGYQLTGMGIEYHRLRTSHAFHSQMMEPILDSFRQLVKSITLNAPIIPYLSNITGKWIRATEATDINYWVKHLRQPVRFAAGLQELLNDKEQVLLELGPGRTLSSLAKQHPNKTAQHIVLSTLRHREQSQSDDEFFTNVLGELWLAGVKIDWTKLPANQYRYRIPLPTYPFERQQYWIEPQKRNGHSQQPSLDKKPDLAEWFYIPSWKQYPLPVRSLLEEQDKQRSPWLIFVDEYGLGRQIASRLQELDQDVVMVALGERFARIDDQTYTINLEQKDDYDLLLTDISNRQKLPQTILHLWNVTSTNDKESEQFCSELQQRGFYSLIFLAQALSKQGLATALEIVVVSNGLEKVTGQEVLYPEKATLLGPCKVIPQEYRNITCRSVDIILPIDNNGQQEQLIDQILQEAVTDSANPTVAYRGDYRWVQSFEAVHLIDNNKPSTRLRREGVYLITGGLGGVGLVLAEYLAQVVKAKLILVGRTSFPAREIWEEWLISHNYINSTSNKIRKLQAIEKLGVEIIVANADITNLEQIQQVVDHAYVRFGRIDGVIHAAGITNDGIIELKQAAEADAVLSPKVKGTMVLYSLFKERSLDFFMLCSSLRSVVGGIGLVDYCAANAFLDLFAQANNSRKGCYTVSVNWDGWAGIGMSVNRALPPTDINLSQENLGIAMLPQEGVAIFNRILTSLLPQIIVSTTDLATKVELVNSIERVKTLNRVATYTTHSRPALHNTYIAPNNNVEQALAEIWREILGVEQIGVEDNFFDLGGDSVISLRIAAKANERGLRVSPKDIFEHQTIAELATSINTDQVIQSEQGLVTGVIPLTPIQKWFFEQNFVAPNHFNQAMLFKTRQPIDQSILVQVVDQLTVHHDALRLRFLPYGTGWQQINIEFNNSAPLTMVDLSALSGEMRSTAIESSAIEFHDSLNISEGPIFRIVLFDCGVEMADRLLIIIHHIATDAISWNILLEDFVTAYRQLSLGETVKLPSKTTSFKTWAEQLIEFAHSQTLNEELGYWLGLPWEQVNCLPVDHLAGNNTIAMLGSLHLSLSITETELLRNLLKDYHVQINEVLLTALTLAFSQWTGNRVILIDLESHGRESFVNNVDPTRTVGWFTNIFPILLKLAENGDLASSLIAVKEYLRHIPNRGMGYGLLHLSENRELIKRLRTLPKAEIGFLYMEEFDLSENSLFEATTESSGPALHPLHQRSHLFDIVARIVSGRLQIVWNYSENRHRRDSVETLTQQFISALRTLITYLPANKAKAYTPSDFPEVNLTQEKLNKIFAEIGLDIEEDK
ncbi:MAG: amino acid adenylation domain-containing protein [Acidobacteriota bacterium]